MDCPGGLCLSGDQVHGDRQDEGLARGGMYNEARFGCLLFGIFCFCFCSYFYFFMLCFFVFIYFCFITKCLLFLFVVMLCLFLAI